MQREDFEKMTAQQVRALARGEGNAERGKPLYFERPWQRVLDEMDNAEVGRVGELNAARVRTLYEGIAGA
jgi:hypothetical protein